MCICEVKKNDKAAAICGCDYNLMENHLSEVCDGVVSTWVMRAEAVMWER